MKALPGKISDRIRAEEVPTGINPGRPDMEQTTNTTPHEGHQISTPRRHG